MYVVDDLRRAVLWAGEGLDVGVAEQLRGLLNGKDGQAVMAASELPVGSERLWLAWYDSTADTPCIAICSTSQGDDVCKGCGRRFAEVTAWLGLSPQSKRIVWNRLIGEGTALRFSTYRDRAHD